MRLSELPEQKGESKIPGHWLCLPVALLLIGMGIYSAFNYFHLHGPPDSELHELKLASVTNVVGEPEILGSEKIDSIWLTAPGDVKVRYRNKFPYSTEVLRLDHTFGLLLDRTNVVWGVTSAGQVLSRSYFEDYNIEAKSVAKVCGGFVGVMGVMILFIFWAGERSRHRGIVTKNTLPLVRMRNLIMYGSIAGYFVIFGVVITPLLSPIIPSVFLVMLWPLGAGLIAKGCAVYFQKHPPQQ